MDRSIEQIAISRVSIEWLVSAGAPGVGRATEQLAQDVERLLPDRLAAALHGLRVSSSEVLFIDQLRLEGTVDVSWSVERIATELARQVARDLRRHIETHQPGQLRYRDRSEFAAAFLIDLLHGHAFGPWRYQTFGGLSALRFSAAVRTLVEQEPELWIRALARLSDGARDSVLRALDAPDVERVLRAVEGPTQHSRTLERVRDFVQQGSACPSLRVPLERLKALARLLRAAPGDDTAELAAALALAGRLDAALRAHPLEQASEAWPAWLRAALGANPGLARELVPLLAHYGNTLEQLTRALAERPDIPGAMLPGEFATLWGGALILLALMEDWSGAWAAFADCGATRGADLARLLVLAAAHGEHWLAVLDDPCLRELLRIEPSLDRARVGSWLTAALAHTPNALEARGPGTETPCAKEGSEELAYFADLLGAFGTHALPWVRLAQALLRELAERMPGFRASGPAFLRRNFLDLRARLTPEGPAWVAWLGRPPLDLVLRMSGLKRRTLRLQAGDHERRVTLQEEE